ncbi:MAG: sugar ABC transporter ATP-binding protein [Caulobacteraceae bacterium]
MPASAVHTSLLEARQVRKAFPGVLALDGVDFTLERGEVHALVGENGAGKSTFIKLLTGALQRDEGTLRLEGRDFAPSDTAAAQRAGVGAVYQEVNLLPNLSVAENLTLGRQPVRFGLVRRREMNNRARALLTDFGLDIDVARPLGDYSVAVQQLVAIARAADLSAKVLVLDEPTASLDHGEVEALFAVVRQLAARGMGIVFITHFLDQIYAVSDRATVFRNGRVVGACAIASTPRKDLIAMMLGREFGEAIIASEPSSLPGDATPLVRFRGLGRRRRVEAFDLDLHAGEIVGAAGLLGSGRTETALLMFGAEASDTGAVEVDGRSVHIRNPRDAVRLGFGFVPEDRKTDGIVGPLSVRENIILALQARAGGWRRLPRRQQDLLTANLIKALDIRVADAETPIEQLSGGNQQKALLARWLATEPRMLILDEPTRGIDVGAHAEIIALIDRLCADGMALYVISSELEELAAYAQRVSIMRDRRQVEMLQGPATPGRIVAAIAADRTSAAA